MIKMTTNRDDTEAHRNNHLWLGQFYTALQEFCNIYTKSREPYNTIPEAIIKRIIQHGGDLNYRLPQMHNSKLNHEDYTSWTLLHFAALKSDLKCFDTLLSAGSDFTIQDTKGFTALHIAILFSEKPRIDHRRVLCSLKEPIYLRMPLYGIEKANSILNFHLLTGNTFNPISNNGISHYQIACMLNNVEAVELFLKAGVPVDQAVNLDSEFYPGYTGLHFATKYLCLETVELLLKYGANMDVTDINRKSPIDILLEHKIEIAHIKNAKKQLLIPEKEEDVSSHDMFLDDHNFYDLPRELQRNYWKKRIIHQCDSEIKRSDSLLTLLCANENNSYEVVFYSDFEMSNFHIYCTMSDISLVQQFLKQQIDVNTTILSNSPHWPGCSALHLAAYCNIETMKLLLRYGGNIFLKDAKGMTPLDICIGRYSPIEICEILSIIESYKNIILSDGSTKLVDVFAALNDSSGFEDFCKKLDDINIAVPSDSPLWPGYTILYLLILFADRRINFDFSCSDNGRDDDERSRYNIDVKDDDDKYLELIEIGLNQGWDVNIRAINFTSPIHFAFEKHKNAVVKLLLKYNRIYTSEDISGDVSLFHIACAVGLVYYVERFLHNKKVNVNTLVNKDFEWFTYTTIPQSHRKLVLIEKNSTPLHIAVYLMNSRLVEVLMNNTKTDPCMTNSYGLTPIHFLLSRKEEKMREVSEELIKIKRVTRRGIQISKDCVTKEDLSHFHVAACMGHKIAVEKLLAMGSDINRMILWKEDSSLKLVYVKDLHGFTPLHCALHYNKPVIARLLIEEGADIYAKIPTGKSPLEIALEDRVTLKLFIPKLKVSDCRMRKMLLHCACMMYDYNWAEDLLENGADVNARIDDDSENTFFGCTPLHVLIQEFNYENSENFDVLFELLQQHKADFCIQNSSNLTPLHLAFSKVLHSKDMGGRLMNFIDILLLKYTNHNVNPVDSTGVSHFHIACMRNHVELVEGFLKNGVDVNEPVDPFVKKIGGYTPLHFAVAYGNEEVTEILLRYGADVTIEDAEGNTPLHKIENLSINSIEKLLSAGADIFAKNMRHEILLERILKREKLTPQLVELYSRRGFCFNSFNPLTKEGLIGMAVVPNVHQGPSLLQPSLNAIIQTSNITDLDENGCSALHNIFSFRINRTRWYRWSLDNYYNQNFVKPIHFAKVVEKLLEAGCEIDHQDKQGRTALHAAVQFEHSQGISALLLLGANINIKDNNGLLPMDYMRRYEREFFLKFVTHTFNMIAAGVSISENVRSFYDINRNIPYTFVRENLKINCENELRKIKTSKLGETLALKDFLTDAGTISEYPTMAFSKKEIIRDFFKSVDNLLGDYPNICGVLMTQYRKALAREKQWKPAMDALITVGVHLPYLCLEMILHNLTNDDLNSLILAAEQRNNSNPNDLHHP